MGEEKRRLVVSVSMPTSEVRRVVTSCIGVPSSGSSGCSPRAPKSGAEFSFAALRKQRGFFFCFCWGAWREMNGVPSQSLRVSFCTGVFAREQRMLGFCMHEAFSQFRDESVYVCCVVATHDPQHCC